MNMLLITSFIFVGSLGALAITLNFLWMGLVIFSALGMIHYATINVEKFRGEK